MVKLFARLVFVTLVSVLVLGAVTNIGVVQAATEVSGVIASDTTWTQANSPYSLTGPVGVSEGVTLTIEPGVTVNLNSHFIQVNGTLQAQGTETEQIQFSGGEIDFTEYSSDWDEQTGNGCIIEQAIFTSTTVDMRSSTKICDNSFTDCLIRPIGTGDPNDVSPIIANNTLNGEGRSYGIISAYSSANITQNTVTGYENGLQLKSDTSVVQGNYITNNDVGVHVYLFQGTVAPIIKNNTIIGNDDGIYVSKVMTVPFSPTIVYNDIHSNTNYNINLDAIPYDINATYNWWGTTNTTEIGQKIYDSNEDFTLGTVTFDPFLTEQNTDITPEFPAWIFLSLLLTITMFAVICKRRYLDTKSD
ncbi:MAG: hypothetical protein CW716_03885 [Candidatus Bathyarchaeum sp.]|nr:MAG: hypothetical protein CW716_03885 [Candidatus Bathyarchaeum sp.]